MLDLKDIGLKFMNSFPFRKACKTDDSKNILSGKIPWKSTKVIAAGLTVFIIGSGSIFYFSSTTIAYNIIIDGEAVGVVPSISEGQKIVENILVETGKPIRQVAKINNTIQYEPVRVNTSSSDKIDENNISKHLNFFIEAAELSIDGDTIATFSSKEEAEDTLINIKNQYAVNSPLNKVESVDFAEEVLLTPIQVHPTNLTSSTEIFELLKKGKVSHQEYIVQPNDSLWLIARKNDMKIVDLLSGNPEFTEDTVLQVGQKINIVKVTPYLTVVSKGIRTVTETIPFEVQTKTDYNLASGKSSVQQYGSDGKKRVTYSYIENNGEITEKRIISEEILEKPITKIVSKGPNRAVATVNYSRGSGTIPGVMWPITGRINSYYGYRWGGFHTGVDINGATGDSYVAAADGTVESADWQGSYGLSILIDHGNGVMTRYAHSSKVLVNKGDKVNKGQTIGAVGSTGRSTGPHLHFEIIVNGDTVNPLSYLP